jgi:hypothetical protein
MTTAQLPTHTHNNSAIISARLNLFTKVAEFECINQNAFKTPQMHLVLNWKQGFDSTEDFKRYCKSLLDKNAGVIISYA